jgi:hypothetical protein
MLAIGGALGLRNSGMEAGGSMRFGAQREA